MRFGHWLSRRGRPCRSAKPANYRQVSNELEQLEPRYMLTQALDPLAAATWFQTVHEADSIELSSSVQGATGTSVGLGGDVIVGRWIVQLSDAALTTVGSPAEAESVLDGYGADLNVLHGLGLPGQILVQASRDTLEQASRALYTNPLITDYEADAYIIGPQEEQLKPQDTRFGDLAGLDNRGQTGGFEDADIDAPEAWHVVDAKLAPSPDQTRVGSRDVVVGVIDSGIDYTHPDLATNVWINPGEIPETLRSSLVDTDDDGLISFIDLNAEENASFVTDTNANNLIDAGDLLADNRWADGSDTDDNEFVDDLTGWDFSTTTRDAGGLLTSPGDNDPMDEHRHGTHVSGILGAVGNNERGVSGVSWTVSILPLRFLDTNNKGATSNAILAINYATMMKQRYVATLNDPAVEDGAQGANVRITNNSWGGRSRGGTMLRDAVAQQGAADILFVAAAGNGNVLGGVDIDQRPFYPASLDLDHVLSVAAVDFEDKLTTFSNFGVQSVDLAAPGLGILSTFPGGRFRRLNGTSMAAPHVSGIAALVAALSPQASALEIREALIQSVDTFSDLSNDVATSGRVNAFGAVTIDTIRPRAELDVADITDNEFGARAQEFTVTYIDNVALDVTSFDSADVVVTRAETGESFPATLQFVQSGGNGSPRSAVYGITPPGGTWDSTGNGTYAISLVGDQVHDTRGNFAEAQILGSFRAQLSRVGQFTVDSLVDSVDETPGDQLAADSQGRQTLRAAIMESNADPDENTIVLPAGEFRLTIPRTAADATADGDLDITRSLTIIGAANGRTVIDAAGLDRVFDVLPTATLTLQDITITGGVTSSGEVGGGVRNAGTLTIVNSTLNDNATDANGGALANLPSATASLTNVTLSGNRSARGAAVFNAGDLSLLNVTIAANSATEETGGVFNQSAGMSL